MDVIRLLPASSIHYLLHFTQEEYNELLKHVAGGNTLEGAADLVLQGEEEVQQDEELAQILSEDSLNRQTPTNFGEVLPVCVLSVSMSILCIPKYNCFLFTR